MFLHHDSGPFLVLLLSLASSWNLNPTAVIPDSNINSTGLVDWDEAIGNNITPIPLSFVNDIDGDWTCSPCANKKVRLVFKPNPIMLVKTCGRDVAKCSHCHDNNNCTDYTTSFYESVYCQTLTRSQLISQGSVIYDSPDDLCQVNDMVIKNCSSSFQSKDMISWVWAGDRVIYRRSLSLSDDQSHTEKSRFRCFLLNSKKPCDAELCLNKKCHGNEDFCSLGLCNLLKPTCFCKIRKNFGTNFFIDDEGKRIYPTCWGNVQATIAWKDEHLQKRSNRICQDCSHQCRDHHVEITVHPKVKFATLRTTGHVVNIAIENERIDYQPTPQEIMMKPSFHMVLWSDDSKEDYWFSCDFVDICEALVSRLDYKNYLLNKDCWPVWLTIVILLASFCMLTITILICCCFKRCLSLPIYVAYYLFTWPILKLLDYCYVRRKGVFKNKVNKENVPLMTADSDENEDNIFDYSKEIRKPSRKGKNDLKSLRSKLLRMGTKTLVIVLVLGQIDEAASCSSSAFMNAQSSSCLTDSSGYESCTISQTSRLAVSPVDQDSCLVVQDDKNVILGTLVIRTESVTLKCSPEKLYFTYHPVPDCSEIWKCKTIFAGDTCKDGCPDKSVFPSLWKDNPKTKVFHTCKTRYADYKDKCAFQGDSCNFERYIMTNPMRKSYEVMKCPSWIFNVNVVASFTSINGTITKKTVLVPGVTEKLFNFDISLIGVSLPPVPDLNKCFIISADHGALVQCSEQGLFDPSEVGTIQCDSEVEAKTASSNCLYYEKLVETHREGETLKCTMNQLDIVRYMAENQLPKHHEGMTIFIDQESRLPSASFGSSAMLEMQINSNNLKLTQKVTMAKCDQTDVSISGCAGCSGGAEIRFKAKSDSGVITASLVCDKLIKTVLQISPTWDEKVIYFSTLIHEVEDNCQLICPGNTLKFSISGSLMLLKNHDFSDKNTIEGFSLDKDMDFDTFKDIVSMIGMRFLGSYFLTGLAVFMILALYIAIKILRIYFRV